MRGSLTTANATGLLARPCFVITLLLEVATSWGTMTTRLAGNRMKDCIRCIQELREYVLQILAPDFDPRAFGTAFGSNGNDFGGSGLRGQAWQLEQAEGADHDPDPDPLKVIAAG
jgi:hypothetical protein